MSHHHSPAVHTGHDVHDVHEDAGVPAAVDRPRPGPGRPGPRRAGHLRGQHRAADDRQVPGAGELRHAVDGHRLPADVRRRPAAGRPHRRPAAPSPGLHDRHARLHGSLARQRLRLQRRGAHRGPWCSRHRRCSDDPCRSVADHDHLPGHPAGPRPRPVGSHRRPGHRGRGARGRRSHHLGRLAGHLLGQRPDRRRRPRRGGPRPPEAARSSHAASRSSTCPVPSPPSAAWVC